MRFVALCTHIDDSSCEIESVYWVRESWLRETISKGLKVKVAIDNGKPVGFAHCLPIELGTWGMTGKDLMTIPCLTLKHDLVYKQEVGSGYGRMLVEAAEAEAKKGMKGVAVLCYDHDFWLMPFSFFKRLGYNEVAREGNKVIMLKAFASVAPPVMHELNYKPQLIPGKVVFDVFWTPICLTSILEIHHVREVCAEYGGDVILNEYNCSNKDILEKFQTTRALFIIGNPKCWGHAAPREKLREELDKALEERC